MNYLKWSQEYSETASQLAAVIEKLKNERRHARAAHKKELDDKLSLYRQYYRECTETAALLLERHHHAA
ncbi:MAG: hypothetical protein IJ598_04740 [Ruminococcus sp.]|nr:hypothetical protein [Ruminococcus sp.]